MISKRFLPCFYLVAICLSLDLSGQKEHLEYALIDNTDPTGWIYVSPDTEPGIRGNQYFFEKWQLSDLVLSNGDVKENIYLNYNLEDQSLEISTQQGIKIVPAGLIKSFRYQQESGQKIFTHHSFSDLPCLRKVVGYHEELFKDDQVDVHLSHSLERKDPTYNEKLGIGDNNIRWINKEQVWLNTRQTCHLISGSKSKREKIIAKAMRNSRISEIVQNEKLNLKRSKDIATLIEIVQSEK